ncbi:hypothetical protein DAPPUDRAFT_109401 [Daphnia pulex]|uniref:Uncharacterized protein n=1 Tax=Daphnia pulex TaxID=6669 RepID=E9H2Y2_DAPPU|nr:hypothetical protein DAPPUDRAFT_109401 [Daphnia pulex]|eukprot:EFX73935.1 hypothetical protein DAPPUDRAFT_109401 [Daphnia pulex]
MAMATTGYPFSPSSSTVVCTRENERNVYLHRDKDRKKVKCLPAETDVDVVILIAANVEQEDQGKKLLIDRCSSNASVSARRAQRSVERLLPITVAAAKEITSWTKEKSHYRGPATRAERECRTSSRLPHQHIETLKVDDLPFHKKVKFNKM